MKELKLGIAIIIFLLLAILWLMWLMPSNTEIRPDILIIRETTESHYGQSVLILDYMVGGIATSAVFYHYQMDEYERVIAYLKSIGRVRYASPFLENIGGQ